MERYIDDEELILQKLSRMIDYFEKNKDKKFNALDVLFQVGDAIMDCPTADVASKREVALEAICDFQLGLRRIFVNMCDGNDYNNLNLLQIDTAIDAFYEHFVEELEKNTRRTENENT